MDDQVEMVLDADVAEVERFDGLEGKGVEVDLTPLADPASISPRYLLALFRFPNTVGG